MNRVEDTREDVRAWLATTRLSLVAQRSGVSLTVLYKLRAGGAVSIETLSRLEDLRLGRRTDDDQDE